MNVLLAERYHQISFASLTNCFHHSQDILTESGAWRLTLRQQWPLNRNRKRTKREKEKQRKKSGYKRRWRKTGGFQKCKEKQTILFKWNSKGWISEHWRSLDSKENYDRSRVEQRKELMVLSITRKQISLWHKSADSRHWLSSSWWQYTCQTPDTVLSADIDKRESLDDSKIPVSKEIQGKGLHVGSCFQLPKITAL